MARTTSPLPAVKSGGALKGLATLALLGCLALVVKNPADAAVWATSLGGWFGNALDSISAFLNQLS